MKRFLLIGSAWFLCVAWLSTAISQASHQAGYVGFDGEVSDDFLLPQNWSDDNLPTADGELHNIEDGQTANLTGAATVNAVHIGDETVGILNVGPGGVLDIISDISVWPHPSGFPTGLLLGGKFHNHTGHGTLNITDNGIVNVIRDPNAPAGQGADVIYVGERGDGVLNVRDNGLLTAPDITWRIGQFGGFFGPELFTAEGTINVEDNGRIEGYFWYLGPNGGNGMVTVSDNGSIDLSLGFDARAIANNPLNHSATIEMIGSNASFEAGNMRFDTINGAPRNQVIFTSDAGGVSPMVSAGLLDYEDAELTVDLSGYGELTHVGSLLLFDGPGGELVQETSPGSGQFFLETFGVLNVLGVADPSKYGLIYRNQTGDISLKRIPEPSTLALVALALVGLTARRLYRG